MCSFQYIGIFGLGGQDDDGNMGGLRIFLDFTATGDTVFDRHHQVADDESRHVFFGQLYTFFSVACFEYFEILFEDAGDERAHVCIVFDDEQALFGGRLGNLNFSGCVFLPLIFRIRCPDRGFFRQINGFVGLEMCLSFRNEQGKCRTFSRFALEGDRTVMEFHGVLDDMQTDSCLAGELRCVRSCNKRIEYMFLKFFGNTNSVVGYFDTAKRSIVYFHLPDMHTYFSLFLCIF